VTFFWTSTFTGKFGVEER